MPLTLGTKLGPYEILSPIGAGGMGEVYKAKRTRSPRTAAKLRTWYFFCFACLYWLRWGYFMVEYISATTIGGFRSQPRAVQQRHYGQTIGITIAPHDVRRTFGKIAPQGQCRARADSTQPRTCLGGDEPRGTSGCGRIATTRRVIIWGSGSKGIDGHLGTRIRSHRTVFIR